MSDSGTCQLLLELGKIKVNGVVVDDEVMKVSERGRAWWSRELMPVCGPRMRGKGRGWVSAHGKDGPVVFPSSCLPARWT